MFVWNMIAVCVSLMRHPMLWHLQCKQTKGKRKITKQEEVSDMIQCTFWVKGPTHWLMKIKALNNILDISLWLNIEFKTNFLFKTVTMLVLSNLEETPREKFFKS